MKKKYGQPEISITTAGHVDHGKTSIVHAITGKWTDEYSEELKRGITIKLGYAWTTIWRLPDKEPPECYVASEYAPTEDAEPLRKISFIDVPGHETLMAIMISGAAIVDGALFVIAANEKCPQPQTREHLMALEIAGIKNIIVLQNKIDLVSKERAKESYEEIRKFLEGTIAEDAPIIPISAHHKVNIDIVLEAIEKFIPTPERDTTSDPIFLVARSFDVNKPGTPIDKMVGGVLGGALKQGKLRVGDEIEIRPGVLIDNEWTPLYTEIVSMYSGGDRIEEAIPGGSVGIGTLLDPSITRNDNLAGCVVGKPDRLPPVWFELDLDYTEMERVVGTKEELKIEPIKVGEPVLINGWTSKTIGVVTDVRKDYIHVKLKYPICILEGEKVTVCRKVLGRWRLVGYGIIK